MFSSLRYNARSVAQSAERLIQEPEVSGSILGPATYFRFSIHWFKNSPVKLAIFSLNSKQIATKGFFAFLLRTSIPI